MVAAFVQDESTGPGTAARLELDELLSQLIERARDVQASQNRLHGLLRANRAVIGDLSLSTVLRRIVEAACELVHAPYGALGVISPDGLGLEEFIHVGMEASVLEAVGHLPEGKGLLGALIDDPRPIRLRDIRDDIRSVGFPDGHPPMRGFLGVPIRVRDAIFGNLYLASLTQGEFSAEDEELVAALAATAGIAIENARLYEESRHRQDWLQASAEVTRRLLTSLGDDALRGIAASVAELASADLVTVVLPAEGNQELVVPVAVGREAAQLEGSRYPMSGTFSEVVLESGRPIVIADASEVPRDSGRLLFLSRVAPVGPAMVLPLAGAQGVRGVLAVGRLKGQREFSDADVEMATNFTHHASVALELADARREAQRMALLEDRTRIARDLHDHVIQQLFASGMTLQGLASSLGESSETESISSVVDTIDDAIRQIRASIFQLRPRSLLGGGLRATVLAVVREVTPTLGHDPRVHFSGPVDTVGDKELADEVTAVVREALTNVIKHAGATSVDIAVVVEGAVLALTVEDDGVGLGQSARSSGLDNLQRRAAERNGSLDIATGAGGVGTRLSWRIPLE
ncbi:MAG: GAF domain-containing protein [Nocardioides sp.]